MKSKAVLMALAMMTTALAGCSGDPDGGGNDEFDAVTLQGMIEAGLQDFMNNTTVEVTTIHHTNETSSTTNYINGSGGSASTIHVLAGASPGVSEVGIEQSNDSVLAILVAESAFSEEDAGGSATGLDGVKACVGTGTAMEGSLQNYFSLLGISFEPVNVEFESEAVEKIKSGECEAIPGTMSEMEELRAGLLEEDNSGNSLSAGVWVTGGIGQIGNSSGNSSGVSWVLGSSHLSLTIGQAAGEAASLSTAYSEITLTGTCVSNCMDQDDTISMTLVFGLGDDSFNSLIFYQPPAIMTSSSCESDFADTDWYAWSGGFGPYGLECDLTLSMTANFGQYTGWDNSTSDFHDIGDYDFEWGDWTYYVMWSTLPVTMHE